jgi:hypothetical protein
MRRLILIGLALGALALAVPSSSTFAGTGGPAPAGVTGIALDSSVQLAWQPVSGASGYTVYRGATPSSITTLLTPAGGVAATTFTDTTTSNGSTYYYAVRSVTGGVESGNSLLVQATPRLRACTAGNPVVLENCFPGASGWDVSNTATIAAGGIEGYASATSINKGGSIDLKVNSAAGSSFRMDIYRMGYYGGSEARLISTVPSVPAVSQPACVSDSTTGLLDCSNWSVTTTITTTSSWTSGVYMVHLVRLDTGTDNQIMFVVRDDARASDLLYGVAMATYQSYNNYGGKSLYTFNSQGSTTVSGTARAVKVSYDRPFEQPRSGLRDWFTRNESAMVSWLEQQGDDVSYISDTDLDQNGALALNHHAYMSPAHDEYFSSGMRTALENARNAGVSLFFSGSNAIYWHIRFENSPVSGGTNRVQVCYKTTESGGPDPSGIPTSAWRDPSGTNKPENALIGQMYIGDNDNVYFPLRVSASEGSDRIYRYTPLASQAPGTSTTIGSNLVGWEWDARAANGLEPAGVKTLATSPVTGELLQSNGTYVQGQPASTTMTKYTAASGALVFATGTNYWDRGLALRPDGVGEPDVRIQQVTTNVLEDMKVVPATPAGNITLDNPGNLPPAPTGVAANATASDTIAVSWSPVAGASAYNIYRLLQPRQGGQPLGQLANAVPVTGTSFSDTGLSSATAYYYVVTAVVGGVQSAASSEATATTLTSPGQATYINAGGPAYTSSTGQSYRADSFFSGGSVTAWSKTITGTNDPALYRDERWGAFTYSVPVANGTYNVRLRFAELYYGSTIAGSCVGKRIFNVDVLNTPVSPDIPNLDICAQVGPLAALDIVIPNVVVTNGVLGIQFTRGPADDAEVTAIDIVPVASNVAPTVTATTPAAGGTGVSLGTRASAAFSTGMDPSTITSSTFTLTAAGSSTPVPASVSYDPSSTTATLTPNASLAPSTTYAATLTAAVKSGSGVALQSPITWTFTTQAPMGPQVVAEVPTGDAQVSQNATVQAQFDVPLDPTTVNSSTFTVSTGGVATPGTVVYNDAARTATFTPSSPFAFSTTYTVTVAGIKSAAGVAMGTPVSWAFTTSAGAVPPPTVASIAPAAAAVNVAGNTTVQATMSGDMDPTSLTASTFTLSGPGGPVAATVAYDAGSRTATLTPSVPLSASTTYIATLSTGVRNSVGEPLANPYTWSFTTQGPPTVVSTSPADGSGFVATDTTVTATFSSPMDPSTVTTASFALTDSSGASVAASVSYNASTNVATLTPSAQLPGVGTYTAHLDTTVKSADGIALASPVTWSFATAACPCQLFSVVSQPASQNLPVKDGRSGTGPWSYEFGVKATVDQPMQLTALRFWKSSSETGTHVGKVWTTGGTLLTSVTFSNETASGWQTQPLTTPLQLQPGTVYVVSVNANAYFASTAFGLQSQVIAGPLRSVADGLNGVYGSSAGVFPNQSYHSTNYFVDLQVVPSGTVTPPTVISASPLDAATGVSRTTSLTATFSRSMDPSTITGSTFTLQAPDGSQVPATVAYNDTTTTASLTVSAPLAFGATYTARIAATARSRDGMALAAAVQWSFTTSAAVPPTVTRTLPASGAGDAGSAAAPRAEFSTALAPATVTAATFTLTGPGGAVTASVTYDAASHAAMLTPSAPLAPGTYTARLDTAITGSDGSPLASPYSWSFTVPSPAPAPLSVSGAPAAGTVGVSKNTTVTAVFSRAVDATTISSSTIRLRAADSSLVPATVTYDPSSLTATLTPNALLNASAIYTLEVTTGVLGSDGGYLGAQVSRSFTTGVCPCSLFSVALVPQKTAVAVADGHTSSVPPTYELGTKISVNQPMSLTAIRFYKDSHETGVHTGTVWTTSGTKLATVTFASETASGWQQQALAMPLQLQPGTVYVVSINANKYYVATPLGLQTQVSVGPLSSVADGKNGVYANSAGIFPSLSFNSNNYFVDVIVQ